MNLDHCFFHPLQLFKMLEEKNASQVVIGLLLLIPPSACHTASGPTGCSLTGCASLATDGLVLCSSFTFLSLRLLKHRLVNATIP